MKYGIDISTYQRNINYMSVKASNIDFAIIRCGFGRNESQKDNMFEEHYSGLKYVGIPVGVYLYSYATSKQYAIDEAKNCLKFLKNKKLDLPVFYDLEEKRTSNLGKEKVTELAIAFCEEIEKAGYKAGVYANLNWFKNYIDPIKIKEKGFKIWLAQWSKKPSANFDFDYWQYSSEGKVHGIAGNVDLDISYSQDVENSVENFYRIGKTYKTQVDLRVREEAGTNSRIKKYKELTLNAKLHSYKQENAVLKPGTKVTCKDYKIIDKDIWIKIPSGWIAGFYNNNYYVR